MDQKIWFITGLSSGLGQALAQTLLEAGEFVVGTFRKPQQAAQFNAEQAGRGFAFVLDLTDTIQIEVVARQAIVQFSRIDVLVNNAGVGFAGAIEETSLTEARAVLETNFFGPLALTQAFLPFFRRQGSGHILQISSHGGVKAFAGFGLYNASKFALEGFSEALAQEVAPLGIRVTLVEPGPFRTQFAGVNFGFAQTEISDYAATAGSFRQRMRQVDGTQEGDPIKAAQAMLTIVRSANPPLRLPLGKVAISSITAKLEAVASDLNASRTLAEQVVY